MQLKNCQQKKTSLGQIFGCRPPQLTKQSLTLKCTSRAGALQSIRDCSLPTVQKTTLPYRGTGFLESRRAKKPQVPYPFFCLTPTQCEFESERIYRCLPAMPQEALTLAAPIRAAQAPSLPERAAAYLRQHHLPFQGASGHPQLWGKGGGGAPTIRHCSTNNDSRRATLGLKCESRSQGNHTRNTPTQLVPRQPLLAGSSLSPPLPTSTQAS